MKWVLIAIILNGWSGQPMEHKLIASFDSKQDCLTERNSLRAIIPRDGTYICANKMLTGSEKVNKQS